MTIAPLPVADTSTNVDALFTALHSAIPTMADDELIETFARADDLHNRAWIVQAHCVWEAQHRTTYGKKVEAIDQVARGFEIARQRAYELAQIWATFHQDFSGQPEKPILPKTFYVEAAQMDKPHEWIEIAEDERAANPFFTVREFKDLYAAKKREQAAATLAAQHPEPAAVERFGVILADPPWQYERSTNELEGTTSHHYGDMTIADLCALPVADVAAQDSILLLWTTWPMLEDSLRLIEAWGYTYLTGFPWIKITGQPQVNLAGAINAKPQYGVGFWTRGCSEPILIARRGDVSPPKNGWVGLLSPNFQHSRKPENLYDFAESIPGPYLELFARRPRSGWTSLGNEIDGKDIRDALTEVIG